MDKYLVIGGGANGLNVCRELIERGEMVDLYTKTLESVSFKYSVGMSVDNYDLFDLPIIEIKPKDYLWGLTSFIFNISSEYMKQEKYFFSRSMEILSKYNIFYKKCSNTYYVDVPDMLGKILTYLQNSDKFALYNNVTIDIKNRKIMEDLKSKYKHIYVCIANQYSHYTKPVYGYDIKIEARGGPNCLIYENGYFIQKRNGLLIIIGGCVSSTHHFDPKSIINKPFWNKYGCVKIVSVEKGSRTLSLDAYPFFYGDKNITYITGGSFGGVIVAPVLAKNILYGGEENDFNFHISRIQKKIRILIQSIMLIILLIYLIFW